MKLKLRKKNKLNYRPLHRGDERSAVSGRVVRGSWRSWRVEAGWGPARGAGGAGARVVSGISRRCRISILFLTAEVEVEIESEDVVEVKDQRICTTTA